MDRTSGFIFLIILFFISSVANAQSYVMRYNSQTHKGDWVVNLFVSVPSNPSSACTTGNFSFDSNYFYVCINTNTWERTALSSWAITDLLLLSDGTSHILLNDGTSKILIRP